MARVKIHVLCGLPLADCLCEGDDPEPVEPGDDGSEDEAA